VLTRTGLHLLELKHWQGEISGDGIQWQRRLPTGKTRLVDNPLLLANRKAKRLASLLGHYADKQPSRIKAPYVSAAVFLHAANLRVALDPVGRQHVYRPHGGPRSGLPDIADLLLGKPQGTGHLATAPAAGRAGSRKPPAGISSPTSPTSHTSVVPHAGWAEAATRTPLFRVGITIFHAI